jgi:drug/metabolite transporter (DMT)-like permease
MVLTAAALFAVNGTVSKVVLGSGIGSVELTQVRSTGACVGFLAAVLVLRPWSLRVTWRELAFLALFGVTGVAFVQWFYFVAIRELPVGIALLIQYLAPLLVALFARYVLHEPVRRRIWLALGLALTGLALVVQVWDGLTLDGVGVAASLGAAFAYATYILMAEHETAGRGRDPASLSFYGFLFAALFWAVVQPVWQFPFDRLDDSVSLLGNLAGREAPVWLLMLFVVVIGTMVTFALITSALRHVSATRVGIAAMFEPVAASVVAWAWLGESFGAAQLIGGGIVLTGLLLAQTAR